VLDAAATAGAGAPNWAGRRARPGHPEAGRKASTWVAENLREGRRLPRETRPSTERWTTTPITFSVILSRFDAIVEEDDAGGSRSRPGPRSWRSPTTTRARSMTRWPRQGLDARTRCRSTRPSLHLGVKEDRRGLRGRHQPRRRLPSSTIPTRATTHIGDYVTAAPVFADGALVFWSVAKGHQMDTGAYIPSSVVASAARHLPGGDHDPADADGRSRRAARGLLPPAAREPALFGPGRRATCGPQIGSIEKGAACGSRSCGAEYGSGGRPSATSTRSSSTRAGAPARNSRRWPDGNLRG